MKKKFIISAIIVIALLLIGGSVYWNRNHQSRGIIFYYSKTCPHCEKVEAFFNAQNVRSKITFAEKEVSQNRRNLMELVKKEKNCGMQIKNYVEVPLLWTGSSCVTGEDNIINFFQGKIK